MSEPELSTETILVHLVRPGGDSRTHHLAEGATLADLLRLSGDSVGGQAILIDGVPIEEGLTLSGGEVVTIMPRSPGSGGAEPWRATVAAFQDEALFREYTEALAARRLENAPDEGPGE